MRYRKWALRFISVVFLGLVWQSQAVKANAFAFAPIDKIIGELLNSIASGELLKATLGTLMTLFVGYLLAASIGIGLGILIALSQAAKNTIEPLINALNTTPVAIFIPVIGISTGLGFNGRVVLICLWTVSIITINTAIGIRETPLPLIEMGLTFSANSRALLRTIILPSAIPFILVGLRLGLGVAFRAAITAELLLSASNLGAFVSNAGSVFNIPRLLAGIVFIALIGVLLLRGAEFAETRIIKRWYKHD